MKKLIPFIQEGLVVLFLVSILLTSILLTVSINIIETPFLFWCAISCLSIVIFYCLCPFRRLFLILIDLLLKRKKTIVGIITDIVPIQASCFSEKWEKQRIRTTDIDYYLLVEVKGSELLLLTRQKDFLVKKKKLRIQYASFSHIVLNIETLDL